MMMFHPSETQEEIFKRREEALKKKDLELQESLIRFSKFLQENDSKRARAGELLLQQGVAVVEGLHVTYYFLISLAVVLQFCSIYGINGGMRPSEWHGRHNDSYEVGTDTQCGTGQALPWPCCIWAAPHSLSFAARRLEPAARRLEPAACRLHAACPSRMLASERMSQGKGQGLACHVLGEPDFAITSTLAISAAGKSARHKLSCCNVHATA
jgi:hypothetical protein